MSLPTPAPDKPIGTSPADYLAGALPGTRVVIRYRLEQGLTDALGILLSSDKASCTVRTRTADVRIELTLVVAAKEVPPAPERRRPRT
ncbi:hypothetical protein [Pseudarthrobacter sp. PS3-L1]|uniref:putative acetyltransferase n=1 Tax=Pseudarthrobacter sp. PS3-L1 TaxID=3046207 RepID=UPI0024BBC1E4|nr:hypothetical protein [Pseudarthrobacter sp. PS3-L1]MDJ0321394.1 hypothetical protein [Pseudarthrobacter sp. PS3-L1]